VQHLSALRAEYQSLNMAAVLGSKEAIDRQAQLMAEMERLHTPVTMRALNQQILDVMEDVEDLI
jgi:hypothetical protein